MKLKDQRIDDTRSVSCELCGSDNTRHLRTENGYQIHKCLACSLVYVNPQPKLDIGEDTQWFTDTNIAGWAERTRKEYAPVYDFGIRYLNGSIPNRGTLLDVGCGLGFFLKKAGENGWETFGIDVSEGAVRYASEKLGMKNIYKSDLLKLSPLIPQKFNAITLWNVLEHVPHPAETLAKAFDCTEKGGVVMARVPNVNFHRLVSAYWNFSRKKLFDSRFSDVSYSYLAIFPPAHLFGFNPLTLKKIFKKAGFRQITVFPSPLRHLNSYYAMVDYASKFLFKTSFGLINMGPSIIAIARK
jgi:2-polyprenyl-3-methyl-5-hydroxy-6-metoxy-1,4-benzoquinol methylase